MCRNIKTLANFTPPATDDEIRASALQFVRKLSGTTKPSKANEAVFNEAVEEVTAAAQRLVRSLKTTAPPRTRVKREESEGAQAALQRRRSAFLVQRSSAEPDVRPLATGGVMDLGTEGQGVRRHRREQGHRPRHRAGAGARRGARRDLRAWRGAAAEAEPNCAALGVQVFAQTCDVATPRPSRAFLGGARRRWAASTSACTTPRRWRAGADLESWEASLAGGSDGGGARLRAGDPLDGCAGGGSLLVVSSISAIEASPGPDFAYSAAKAAQLAYVKKLATLHAAAASAPTPSCPAPSTSPAGSGTSSVRH
jgi:hypothetical protein